MGGLFVGLIFRLLCRTVTHDLNGGSAGLLPLGFFGVMLGLRPDGDFIVSFFPSVGVAGGLYVLLRLLARLPNPLQRRKPLVDGHVLGEVRRGTGCVAVGSDQ